MKTERMTFVMTPEDKAKITGRAAKMHIPASELIRRAVDSYDPDVEGDEIQMLAGELKAVVDATDRKLDTALSRLAAFEAYFAQRDDLRLQVRAEVATSGLKWPFGGPGAADAGRKAEA